MLFLLMKHDSIESKESGMMRGIISRNVFMMRGIMRIGQNENRITDRRKTNKNHKKI